MHKTRLNTNTAASWNTESILAFNYNVYNDFMLVNFLRELMDSQPEKWNVIRAIFKGKKDVSLTMVDRYVNTPFRCQMLAHFCKQLQKELDFTYKSLNVMLTPIKEKIDGGKYGVLIADDFKRDGPIRCACMIPANNNFEYTIHRDMYLKACANYELDVPMKLKVKENPVHCRDLNISTGNYTLSIRTFGGITGAWACKSKDDGAPSLNPLKRESLVCTNLHRIGRDKAGVFINVDLQVRAN